MNNSYNIYLLENIIINITIDKYNKKINCQCEEKFNNTIVVSLDEIKNNITKLNLPNFTYKDIEYLFYETYKIKDIWNYIFCNLCTSKYDIKILKYLKSRIKYQDFSRYYRKSNNVHISHDDSGDLLIVFELKKLK